MDLHQLQQALEQYLNSENLTASPSEYSRIVASLQGTTLHGICELLLAERPVIEGDKNLQRKLAVLFGAALERFPENKTAYESISSKEPKVSFSLEVVMVSYFFLFCVFKFWSLFFPKTPKSIPPSPVRSRWLVPREERKRILECFERARDDQKRLKKKNWSRSGRPDEFEELFEAGGLQLLSTDLQLSRLNEQVFCKANQIALKTPSKSTEATPKYAAKSESTPRVSSSTNSSPRKRPRSRIRILDFDALESLLLSLESKMRSARAVLDAAAHLLRSEALFADDFGALKDGGDQPSVNYYRDDDDMAALPTPADAYFRNDELGRFARGNASENKKFYRQRAQRFRFLSSQDLCYFFPSGAKRKTLRDDLFQLKRTVREFEDFLQELFLTPPDDLFLVVEAQRLVPAMALLTVIYLISPEERNDYRSIGHLKCLRSSRKFGLQWTLRSILEQKGVEGEECVLVSIRGHGSESMMRACRDLRIE